MISYLDAIQILLSQATPTKTETRKVVDAIGCVASQDIASTMNLPRFQNSGMDGFAVRCEDIASASKENPVNLKILRAIAAGDAIPLIEGKGTEQIMTGAPVPDQYDAVIPVEEVEINGDILTLRRPGVLQENVRKAGEDIALGEVFIQKGDLITNERLLLLAALGVSEIEVFKIPDLYIFSTGKELVDHTESNLKESQIYNSNAPYLVAIAKMHGLNAIYKGTIADDEAIFKQQISSIPQDSMIITMGAVSKGVWDFIPKSLEELGAKTHFHRVNIRPGKPFLFSTLPNGNQVFGLPGNPISTAVGFRFFLLPLFRFMRGQAPEKYIQAKLVNSFKKKINFRQFLKAHFSISDQGEACVEILGGQESFKISPLARCNAWVILEERENLQYDADSLVSVLLIDMGSLNDIC